MNRWRCAKCKRPREAGDTGPLAATLTAKFRQGKCPRCHAQRYFEAVPVEVYRGVTPAGAPDPAMADRLAEKGMTHAELNEAMSASGWNERADAAIRALAVQRVEFTAEDVTKRVGLPSRSPNAVGSRINSAARKGIIEWTGRIVKAQRPSRHSNTLRVWRGAEGANRG